ncbi:uncharacterized protein METZ01_LOCUS493429 [marine metagenome]|uniref:Uncharacterized protein n=1 Tax=marine metagenome TaxID=408172 RepID=A0A383D8J6_9ZZZZ
MEYTSLNAKKMARAAKPSNSVTEYPIMIERKKFKILLRKFIKPI